MALDEIFEIEEFENVNIQEDDLKPEGNNDNNVEINADEIQDEDEEFINESEDEVDEDVGGGMFSNMLSMTDEDNEAIYQGCVADDAEEYGDDEDSKYPEWTANRVQEYRSKLQHPLYEGLGVHCRVNLIDAIFFLLKIPTGGTAL